MATMGGSIRLAFLIGPLLGGWMVEVAGYRATFFAAIGAMAASDCSPRDGPRSLRPTATSASTRSRIDDRRHAPAATPTGCRCGSLCAATVVCCCGAGSARRSVMTVREGRNVVVPLVAIGLDLSPAQVGAVVAVGTGADLLLFPLSGYVMDRHGRLAAMIPAFGLLAIGLFVLAVADSASDRRSWPG